MPTNDRRIFFLALALLGIVLTVGVVPGIFIVDENNYLVNVVALRQGHVTVTNTAGLPPSRELLFFDPAPWSRVVEATPVASNAPPLYALIALPFSLLGWRGLVALNTLGYLATTAMVFWYAGKHATENTTRWLAAGAYALCGFSIEYAMGLWPQMLSVALCTGGILAASESISIAAPLAASISGFLLALAAGVRYQNAMVLATIGGALVFSSRDRWRSSMAFWLSAALPLSISAAINLARLGSWNPISKGPGYLDVPLFRDNGRSWLDPLVMFWSRVCDYSYRPRLTGASFEGWVSYDPSSGSQLMLGLVFKKALLQSAPWAALALLFFALAWLPRFQLPDQQRRPARIFAAVVFVTFGVFAFSDITRDEGLAFNQRYFLELVPLAAITAAWTLDAFASRLRTTVVAACLTGVIILLILQADTMFDASGTAMSTIKAILLLKLPLFLSAAVCALWLVARRQARVGALLAVVAGICLGWAFMVHVGDDLSVAQSFRKYHSEQTQELDRLVPNGSALVTNRATADAAGALVLKRDLVILQTAADGGDDTPTLVNALRQRNKRVFLLDEGFSPEVRSRLTTNSQLVGVGHLNDHLVELIGQPH